MLAGACMPHDIQQCAASHHGVADQCEVVHDKLIAPTLALIEEVYCAVKACLDTLIDDLFPAPPPLPANTTGSGAGTAGSLALSGSQPLKLPQANSATVADTVIKEV